MTRFAPVLLAALLPLSLAAEDKKDPKKEPPKAAPFAPKDGKFSVVLPGKPTEKTNSLKLPAGDVKINLFTLDLKDRAYIVTYSDYPKGALDADANKVLTSVIEGNAKSLKGKVASDEKIKVGKKEHPGRDIRIEFGAKKQVYRARVVLVGSRLYQVVALGPDEFAKSKDVDDYLKSFMLED